MNRVRLQLPATSANLGPGFDTLALALNLFLEIEAGVADDFSIEATGRNAAICADLKNHLLIKTYRAVLAAQGKPATPLWLRMRNAIPLGMGLGSSAAACLAGVALAAHFGGLAWGASQIVAEAARLEGHPDNVAACWYGGFTVAGGGAAGVATASIAPPPEWKAIVVLPEKPVATHESRSVLPESYLRKDVVKNLQNAALLTAAFALARPDLVTRAMEDTLHQPYRMELCPLLPALLPLAGSNGVLSVTLSGAGPSVLLLCSGLKALEALRQEIAARAKAAGPVELIEAGLWSGTVATVVFGDLQ
ncbi:MAG TPA: homoserine kinase [Acidobacteriaceae bacterium]|nr:homoserine kinase [Acidobacteriaceae bacterium]